MWQGQLLAPLVYLWVVAGLVWIADWIIVAYVAPGLRGPLAERSPLSQAIICVAVVLGAVALAILMRDDPFVRPKLRVAQRSGLGLLDGVVSLALGALGGWVTARLSWSVLTPLGRVAAAIAFALFVIFVLAFGLLGVWRGVGTLIARPRRG